LNGAQNSNSEIIETVTVRLVERIVTSQPNPFDAY
jgi:hypothetical protein